MDILNMEGIKKYYDDQCVLSIDSLSIQQGTISGYLGKNGAGKSTTIKIIMGIITPDQGTVSFQNRVIDYNNPSHKKHLGYCPDYPAVFEKLTVLEHLNFMAHLFGITDTKESEKRIHKYLNHFEIEKYKNTLIKNLSRGNKQKISIISSLIHEPDLLVYDEPTLGLDPPSIKQFKSLLTEYTKNGGTIFLSSHSLNTVEEIADTVSIIHNGSIVKKNILVRDLRENLVSVEDYLISVVEGRE